MEEDEQGQEPRTDELTRRAADDVAALAHRYAGVARREVAAAGERALWPTALAALGTVLLLVGGGMLVASPAVPPAQRRLKRRLHLVALGYLTVGAAGAIAGGLALVAGMRGALPRTRHNVHEAIDTIRERL